MFQMTADVAGTGVAAQELTHFIERVERLEEEKSHFRRYSRSLRGNEGLRVRREGRARARQEAILEPP
jgi:hypothetical protein